MHFLYNLAIRSAENLLPLAGSINEKLRIFNEGRKDLFKHLASEISPTEKTIWFHAASLGEYEQAVPVIEAAKKIFPSHKIVLSFFSPSGYEVKKDSSLADVVTYLPLDTTENATKFLDLVHPDWTLFVKYEFWPNFLNELKKRKMRSLLISGAFREDQLFFKSYGKWMRRYLEAFEFFFLQNEKSKELLRHIGFENAAVSGDTRFDRVSAQPEQDNKLDFIENFVRDKICIVAGSTWPEDEELLLEFINNDQLEVKLIIAPHAIKPEKIKQLQEKLEVDSILYSEKDRNKPEDFKVFIIDTVGLLSRIYSYADIAYVGGAAGDTGLHNILEPAAFGVPVIIGKNYSRFPEAEDLKNAGGLVPVQNRSEAREVLAKLVANENERKIKGSISAKYIQKNKGATQMISEYLLKNR
ncbi:3-deoxy-D-manno-octulosonic acid transferase [Salinimicrobium sp. HB62]|uniref:3-deoxy-D-manno-octulosonic acid transferase n=1 Tax=Salinimicrobium sp. HB62 TaxID=3077781 RepID=UPI002D794901|nr:glycosyltransferase N-terminal domain-containing protein [Salinimicrobium sp. HB62]